MTFDGTKYVTPLFRILEGNRPEQGATGTWISIGDERFLVTAAHAIEREFEWFPSLTGLRRLTSPGVITTCPPAGRTSDRCDLAVFHLTQGDQEARHPRYESVGAELIDASLNYSQENFFEFTGFPYRKNEFDVRNNRVDLTCVSVIAETASVQQFHELGLSVHAHVLIPYTKKNMLRGGKRINVPLLHGVSGGAVWKIECGSKSRTLVGIGIECPKGFLVGIRISMVLEYLRLRFPYLSPFIPKPMDLDLVVTNNRKPIEPFMPHQPIGHR